MIAALAGLPRKHLAPEKLNRGMGMRLRKPVSDPEKSVKSPRSPEGKNRIDWGDTAMAEPFR